MECNLSASLGRQRSRRSYSGNWGLVRGTKLRRLSQRRRQEVVHVYRLGLTACSVWNQDQVRGPGQSEPECSFLSSTASELGSSCRLAISVTLLLWVFQSGLSSGPPPPPPLPPGLGLETRRLQEAQASSSVLPTVLFRGPEAGAGSDHENGKCGLAP